MPISIETINEKLTKGETLSPEETKFVMAQPPETTGLSNKEADEDEQGEIDWGKAEDLEKKEEAKDEKKEEAPKEKEPEKKPEEAKKEEKIEPPKEEEDNLVDFAKIERELAKPEGQEDLSAFKKKEASFFYQLRNERKARKKAEEERDAARFREVQRQQTEKAKEPEEKKEEDPLAELKARDPEDFMTVKEVVTVLEKVNKPKKEEVKKEEVKEQKPPVDPFRLAALRLWESEAKKSHDDFDAVMELHEELLSKDEKNLPQIAQAIVEGKNPAETAYQLIKSHPDFAKLFPAAEIRVKARQEAQSKPPEKTPEQLKKEQEAKAAEEALEKNKEKTKTTGHASGEAKGSEGTIDGVTVDDIMKMSDLEFSRLPKKTREAFLQKYG